MIRVELVKLLRRPRTWITIVALNARPTLVAVLLGITHLGPRPGTGPPFLSAVLTDGTLFPLAALGIGRGRAAAQRGTDRLPHPAQLGLVAAAEQLADQQPFG